MRWALRSFQTNCDSMAILQVKCLEYLRQQQLWGQQHPIPALAKGMPTVAACRNTADSLLFKIYKSGKKPKAEPKQSILEQWGSNQPPKWNDVLTPFAVSALCCSVLVLILLQHLTCWNSSGLINLTFPLHWKASSHHVLWANKFQHENPSQQCERSEKNVCQGSRCDAQYSQGRQGMELFHFEDCASCYESSARYFSS